MGRIIAEKAITGTEAEGLLSVITDYSLALRLLDQYDHQQLRLNLRELCALIQQSSAH